MERLIIKLMEEGYSLEEAKKIALIAEKRHNERIRFTKTVVKVGLVFSLILFGIAILMII